MEKTMEEKAIELSVEPRGLKRKELIEWYTKERNRSQSEIDKCQAQVLDVRVTILPNKVYDLQYGIKVGNLYVASIDRKIEELKKLDEELIRKQ